MIAMSILLAAAAVMPHDDSAFRAAASGLERAGKYDRMLDLANRQIEASASNDPLRSHYLITRAEACIELQDRECASTALDDAQPVAEAAHDTRALADLHWQRGFLIWRFDHDLDRASREYDQALAYARSVPDWQLVTATLNSFGNMYRNPQNMNPAEALRRYSEGLAIARREHLQAVHLLKNIGQCYRLMNRPDLAEGPLLEAVDLADQKNIAEVRWMARLELGLIDRDRDPAKAERYFTECLSLLDEEESGVSLDNVRPGAFAAATAFANPFDAYIDFLMARNRPAEAFLVAERQRARVFLENLSASREHLVAGLPPGYAAEEAQTLASLHRAQAALRSSTLAADVRTQRIAEVQAAENRLATLRLRLALEQPAVAHERFPKLWTAAELQSKLLHPDEALLSFYVAPNRSFAWLVSRDGLQTFVLPPANVIKANARAALADFRNPKPTDAHATAALSRALAIDRIASGLRRPHLVIVPHGILNDIPFEALLIRNGHPLIERAAISYAPSASSLAFLRGTPRPSSHSIELIAVANPLVTHKPAQRTRQFDLAHMDMLAPLPHTGDEVRQVATLFGSGARVLEGALATRTELQRQGVDRSRILHFATHGLIDESHPDRSGLLLTAATASDDGLLQVREIYAMRLNADLVTLSACETALGKEVTGEGIIGLTRAFFFAGAHAVVASLWDVDDESTSVLMQSFYANIRRGEPIDVALQHAKLELIRAGGVTRAPFYWASFIASGDARPAIEQPSRSSWPVILIAAAAVVLIATARKIRRAPTA